MSEPRSSAAAVRNDEVGEDARCEPAGKEDQPQLPVAVAAHPVPDLRNDVEDRAARDRVGDQLERV